MSRTAFLNVDEQVARNPVARSIAKHRLARAIRDFQLRIHTMQEGEVIVEEIGACAQVLTVCMFALEHAGEGDHPSISVMRGARSALVQCAQRGNRWRTLDAIAVDTGLQHAADLYPQLAAVSVTWGWQQMRKIEQQVAEKLAAERAGQKAQPISQPEGEHA